ncbi:MAG: hypothetical protein J6V92_03165 [Bacteroidaceae bacterium]|jgi:ATP-dependent exoDNAse (exonuclease V) beta subunit|nr:hypothetical protein [Bacteroidaceae bacterium]
MNKFFTILGEPEIVTDVRRRVLREFQDLEFYEEGHRYVLNGQSLPSVSNVAHRFIREPFNEQLQAKRYAEKHGETPEHWIQQWRQNSFRATTLGTKTHAYGESLGYLRAGMPERICPLIQPQYMPEYDFLAPIHPKEEAVLKFMNEMPCSMHLVINEAKVHSGKNPCQERNLREKIAGTFDMLYYQDGTDGQPEGFVILDYKTNANLASEYNRKYGKMLREPFNAMTEEDLSLYTIQLSLYALMLEDIGIPIISRRIVWLKDSEYQIVPVEDVSEKLRQVL